MIYSLYPLLKVVSGISLHPKSEQLDLFSIDDDQIVDDENVTQYLPVKWVDIYQQRVG
ncbi:hypothetical protein [Lactiplantibacillus paraplantarum]|uniref:hypothetical protein n=1 Tax=Lactiplantibacillus paraplantarum TaxID=60520 RepID=UPI0023F88314|nr:hypothetical protein [Lactiplantibacillus paraplantarum]